MIACKTCKIPKPESEFRERKPPKKGYYGDCRLCESKGNIKRREGNPSFYKEIYRKRVKRSPNYMKIRRIERYNISESDYNDILISQNNCCAICGKPNLPDSKRLHIDHDHLTNKVRGLLCFKCNYGLGMFNDNSELLFNAINYLKQKSDANIR